MEVVGGGCGGAHGWVKSSAFVFVHIIYIYTYIESWLLNRRFKKLSECLLYL